MRSRAPQLTRIDEPAAAGGAGRREQTPGLVWSLFKKKSRAWLARFARLLGANTGAEEDLERFFRLAETPGSFPALLETARLIEGSRLTWQDLRAVAGLLGSKDFSSFLVEHGEALRDMPDLRQALSRADSRRQLLRTVELVKRAPAMASTLENLSGLDGERLRWAAQVLNELAVPSTLELLSELPAAGEAGIASLATAVRLLGRPASRDLTSSMLALLNNATPGLKKGLSQLLAAQAAGEREYHLVPDVYGRNHHLLHDIRREEVFMAVAEPTVRQGLSLLYYDRLYNLYEALANVCRLHPEATLQVAEVGVYQGGTSSFLCGLLRKLHGGNAAFYAIDTFQGHSALDLPRGAEGPHLPRKFEKTSAAQVTQLLSEFPFARVIQGRIQECAEGLDAPTFHFVHLDVDIYEPIAFSLRFFLPRLAAGGVICVDDYNKTSCPGVRRAVDEALGGACLPVIKFYTQTGQCLLIRAGA